MRLGFDVYFPSAEYILVLRYLSKQATGNYADLRKEFETTKFSTFGVKLARMIDQNLIKKVNRGMYSITPFGIKVLKAYDAYMKVMKP